MKKIILSALCLAAIGLGSVVAAGQAKKQETKTECPTQCPEKKDCSKDCPRKDGECGKSDCPQSECPNTSKGSCCPKK